MSRGGRYFASDDFYFNVVEFSITENPLSPISLSQARALSLSLLAEYNNHTAARAREIYERKYLLHARLALSC